MRSDELPFEHPWEQGPIGKYADVIVGGTPSTAISAFWGGDVLWMASGDVHLRRIKDVPGRISEYGLAHSNAVVVPPKAVAVGLAGQGKTRGTVAITYVPLSTNQSVALVRPKDNRLNPEFLFQALDNRYEELRGRSAGGGRAGLSKGILENTPIQVPPPNEQEYISDVLFTIDEAIEQTEALIAKTQQIKAGLMQDLFTRGVTPDGKLRPPQEEAPHLYKESPLGWIPKEWETRTLKDIGTWTSGGTPSKAQAQFWGGELPWVTPKDMKVFRLKLTADHLTQRGAMAGSRIVPKDSVFIVVRGMILAHTFPVCLATRDMAFNQDVKAIVPNAAIDGEFLAHWFVASKDHMLGLVTEATHGTKRIDMRDLLRSLIGVPKPQEQRKLVDILNQFDITIELAASDVSKLREEKQGLMHDLLTGRVPVKVPESAEGLAHA